VYVTVSINVPTFATPGMQVKLFDENVQKLGFYVFEIKTESFSGSVNPGRLYNSVCPAITV
jgi:hypothetical protein